LKDTQDSEVILRFSNNRAALLECRQEKGTTLFFSAGMDMRAGDFPLHGIYVPFVREAVRLLQAHETKAQGLGAGHLMQIDSEATIELPDGSNQKCAAGATFALTQPGIYSIKSGTRTELYAVNGDPKESDLTPAAAADIEKLIASPPETEIRRTADGFERILTGDARTNARTQTESGMVVPAGRRRVVCFRIVCRSNCIEEMMTALQKKIDAVRSAWRRTEILKGGATLLADAVIVVLALIAIDAIYHLPTPARALLLAVGLATLVGAAFLVLLRPLKRQLPDSELAIHVETRYPALNGMLMAAVEYEQYEVTDQVQAGLVGALVVDCLDQAARVNIADAIDKGRLKQRAIVATVLLAFFMGAVLIRPDLLKHQLARVLLPWIDVPMTGD